MTFLWKVWLPFALISFTRALLESGGIQSSEDTKTEDVLDNAQTEDQLVSLLEDAIFGGLLTCIPHQRCIILSDFCADEAEEENDTTTPILREEEEEDLTSDDHCYPLAAMPLEGMRVCCVWPLCVIFFVHSVLRSNVFGEEQPIDNDLAPEQDDNNRLHSVDQSTDNYANSGHEEQDDDNRLLQTPIYREEDGEQSDAVTEELDQSNRHEEVVLGEEEGPPARNMPHNGVCVSWHMHFFSFHCPFR